MQTNEIIPAIADVRFETDLSALAKEINAAHTGAETALAEGLEHARRAGELLLAAKQQAGHGNWLPWMKKNVRFSERTASSYMRISRRWGELTGANQQQVADLTFRDALALLTEKRSDQRDDDAVELKLYERLRYREEIVSAKAGSGEAGLFEVRPDAVVIAGRVFHTPFSAIIPDIEGAAWERFKDNFRRHGFMHLIPVPTIDPQDNVIDGRQRLRVVAEMRLDEVPVRVCLNASEADKLAMFKSANLYRKHHEESIYTTAAYAAAQDEIKGHTPPTSGDECRPA